MKKHIPNIITLSNLLCGCIAIVFVTNNNFVLASVLFFLGIFFDFFDGFAARKLKVQSELGLQLDSLADMVTSGLLPGLILYKLFLISDLNQEVIAFVPFFGFLVTLGSAYRLAKFNLDDEQKTYFKGLPTPANALFIVSLPLILEFQDNDFIKGVILNKWFLVFLSISSFYILNSSIKLFALKFSDFSFKANSTRYIYLLLSIVLLVVMQFMAIPIIIFLYIIMSVVDNYFSKSL